MFYLEQNLNDFLKYYPKDIPENSPSVNILEKENYTEVQLCVPGFEKEEFNISYDNEILEIKGNKKEKKEYNYLLKEFTMGSFLKSIRINTKLLDVKGIISTYVNGILIIKLPYLCSKNKEKYNITIQ